MVNRHDLGNHLPEMTGKGHGSTLAFGP